jgi:hypothetical protein
MIQCARNIQIVKKEESMITRAIITQLEKEEEERESERDCMCSKRRHDGIYAL